MTKPSYEEHRITKHSGSPQIVDSASGSISDHATTETRRGGRWGGERRGEMEDRRWFYPGRIQNRGKSSLPFTTRESDYIPTNDTVRRAGDILQQQRINGDAHGE